MRVPLDFIKMHGTRNDFVLVDAREREPDGPALARAICDRHGGIGADGLLLVRPSKKAALRMRTFNPDGSEAEMCGNGIRCVIKYAVEAGLVAGRGPIPIQTKAGLKTVWPVTEGGSVIRVRVDMGPPELAPDRVPVAMTRIEGPVIDFPLTVEGTELRVTCLSMGNPHAVAFLDSPVEEFPLERLGPAMEHHPFFPARVNFSVVNRLGPDRLRGRVWERGAGLTMACGTGACAAVVAGHLKGLTEGEVEIELPGGTLSVAWDGYGLVYLEGPVEEVFRGRWPA